MTKAAKTNKISLEQARRERRIGGVSYTGPRDVWGAPLLKDTKYTPECAILNRKKIQTFLPNRGPVIMFPLAPLWLSTCLVLREFPKAGAE